MGDNGIEHHDRRLGRIDVDDQVVAIVVEQWLRFALIGVQPLPNDFLIRVVEAVVLDSALFQSLDDLGPIRDSSDERLSSHR